MKALKRWYIVIGDGFFGLTGDFKEICEAGMADIMTKSTEDYSEHLERSEVVLCFWGVHQKIWGIHDIESMSEVMEGVVMNLISIMQFT